MYDVILYNMIFRVLFPIYFKALDYKYLTTEGIRVILLLYNSSKFKKYI